MAAPFPGHHGRHASAGRHMADREYLYVHLPDLPLRLICNEKGWQIDKAIALYWRHQNMDRLVYLSDTAKKAGLYAGMAVADARARLPDILLAEIAPQQDRTILEKLARWAWRYSPRAGIDAAGPNPDSPAGGNGIWIDMSGASHLHGGIEQVIADIKHHLHTAEIPIYCAAAPYYSAARALAHYYNQIIDGHNQAIDGLVMLSSRQALMQILSELPLSALSLEDQLLQALSQAGLRRLRHLQPLSYAQLAIRFGPDFVQKWAVLCGNRDYTPTPHSRRASPVG